MWRAWSAFSQLCKADRTFRKAMHMAKTDRFRFQVEVIEAFARKGDTRAPFQSAGRFGGKKRRRSLQLRGAKGEILSHAEQIRILQNFYTELYTAGPSSTGGGGQPLSCLCLDSVAQALQRLSPHSAAPAHLAHTSLWVTCSEALAPWLVAMLHNARQIPQIWKDTWLSLLPKLSMPTLPRQLRPLGISEISGSCLWSDPGAASALCRSFSCQTSTNCIYVEPIYRSGTSSGHAAPPRPTKCL